MPACEHLLVLLVELQGCAVWPERFALFALPAAELAALVRAVQTCLAAVRALQETAERELLALDEFFKWWRMGTYRRMRLTAEQDRQERLKTEEMPRVIPTHDTLTVLELVRRGFVSPELDALLGAPEAPSAAPAHDTSMDDTSQAPATVHDPTSAVYAEAPSAPPVPSLDATIDTAFAYLEAPQPAAPDARVYDVPQLFVPPEHAFTGPRALPGDAQTLGARFANVTERIATLLSAALQRTMGQARTVRAPLGTWDVVCRDDTWCSVPADVRAAPCPAIQVCRIGAYTALRTGPDEVRIVRADDGSACVRVPDVLDIGAQDDTHLVVLHGRGPYALGIVALAALAYDATPAPRDADWARTVPCVWDDGAPSRLAVRGRTCVVLGDDAQTLAYAAWVE